MPAQGPRHGGQRLEHPVGEPRIPPAVAQPGHLVPVQQQHQEVPAAPVLDLLIPGDVALQVVAAPRPVQLPQRLVGAQGGEGGHQRAQAVQRHTADMHLPTQPGRRPGLPPRQLVPVQPVPVQPGEPQPVLHAAQLRHRADGGQERLALRQGRLERGGAFAVVLHEGQHSTQQHSRHAPAAPTLPHAAPYEHERGMGRVVLGPFPPEAHAGAADDLPVRQGQHPAVLPGRPAPAHVVFHVGVGQHRLARVVLHGAGAAEGVEGGPLCRAGGMRVEWNDVHDGASSSDAAAVGTPPC